VTEPTAPTLTATDRFWRTIARWIDKPVLHRVANQKALRVLFGISTRLGSAVPRAATVIRDRADGLTVTPQGVSRDAPVIFYIHGGGFTIGSPRTHAALAGHLAAHAGMRAYLPRYRLAPEHPFPAARDDVIARYTALCDTAPPAAICGDSAGGCLALQLAQHIRDNGLPAPRALGLIGPIADLSRDPVESHDAAADEMLIPPEWADRIRKVLLPGHDPADPGVSPLFGDLTRLPPTLIHASAEEALAHDARRLAEAMDRVTLDLWPGLPHVWHIHAGRAPAADRALTQMGAFIADHAR
jgi:monoterpene epsilon-lactone hydrolase